MISGHAATHQLLLAALLHACSSESVREPGPMAPAARTSVHGSAPQSPIETLDLPTPTLEGKTSLEEALATRVSIRAFTDRRLTRAELGQLLWAAQGITHGGNRRTTPSAGAKYPLELYVVTPAHVLHYLPRGHRIEVLHQGDRRERVQRAALNQSFVGAGAALFVIAADYGRTIEKYGPERSPRYVHLEAGHAAHGILLQATALGLGGTAVGGFRDQSLAQVVGVGPPERVVYLVVIGEPAVAP